MSQDHLHYLNEVKRLAETALVQTETLTRCEHHKDVLLHNDDGGTEPHVVCNLASIWLKDEVGMFARADVEDAIRDALDRAAKDGCPKCACRAP